MRRRILALVALLAACSNTHGPKTGTQTGNPPVLDRGGVTLEVSEDTVHITGPAGTAAPGGATIEITNLTTGMVIEGMAAADGSFDVRVDGSVNDAFSVRAIVDGEASEVVYVVRGGAAIAGDEDGSLSCRQYGELAGAVLDATVAAADTSCNVDSDCSVVPAGTSCHGCKFAYLSESAEPVIEAAVRALEEGLCAAWQGSGCGFPPAPCLVPQPGACIEGQCTPDGELSCDERRAHGAAVVAAAVAAADTSCTVDGDCVMASTHSLCNDACKTLLVSREGEAQIRAAVGEVNAGVCKRYETGQCTFIRPPCVPPAPAVPRCDAGRCTLVAPEDDPADCTRCLEETLEWSTVGGLGSPPYGPSELRPCARYFHTPRDPEVSPCERDLVACNAAASTGAVMNALAGEDVQRAFDQSPVIFGRDARVLDGFVFRITLGERVIEVGYPCGDDAGSNCVPTPAGVEALMLLLRSIDDEMLASEECAESAP